MSVGSSTKHPYKLLLERLEASIQTITSFLPRTHDGELGLPLLPPGRNQTALPRAGSGGRAVSEAYAPKLLEDLRVLGTDHIRHLMHMVHELWAPNNEQEMQELLALEESVFGAVAKVNLDAKSAATQYDDVFGAYVELRRAVEEVLQGVQDIVPVLGGAVEGMIEPSVVSKSFVAHINRIEKERMQFRGVVGEGVDPMKENRYLRNLLQESNERMEALRKIVDEFRSKESQGAVDKDRLYKETRRRNQELVQEVAALRAGKRVRRDRGKNDPQCVAMANNFKDVVAYQVLPYVPDYTDHWFVSEWTALYRRIFEWADSGYRYLSDIKPGGGDFETMFWGYTRTCNDRLCSIYSRDIAVRASILDGVVNHQENRTFVCMGLVYRILHEEVFEAFRNFLTVEIPDPRVNWMHKEQPVVEFLKTRKEQTRADRTPTSWKKRKYDEILARNSVDGRAIDETMLEEDDSQVRDLMNLNPTQRIKCEVFKEMDTRKEPDSMDMTLFNTTRAKMMKALFTLESEPLHPHLQEWRSRIVDLIFDTVEPFRIKRGECGDILREEEIPARRALKEELWKIVKQAFSLAINMRCQRSSYITDFRRPIEDCVYDPETMRHVSGEPEGISSMLELCRETEGVGFEANPVGRVMLAISPALIKVGNGRDWTVRRHLVKMSVVANIHSPTEMERVLTLTNIAALEDANATVDSFIPSSIRKNDKRKQQKRQKLQEKTKGLEEQKKSREKEKEQAASKREKEEEEQKLMEEAEKEHVGLEGDDALGYYVTEDEDEMSDSVFFQSQDSEPNPWT